jgi:hypothetical protein
VQLDGVEGRLDHLAVDVQSQRLFVSGLENHTVEVVDLAKRQRIHEITGISEPQGLVFIPEKNRLIVCCRGDGTCRSFDANTFEEGPWVDLGRNADNVRFDAGAKIIYVGSAGEPGNGLLSAMDLAVVNPPNRIRPPISFWTARDKPILKWKFNCRPIPNLFSSTRRTTGFMSTSPMNIKSPCSTSLPPT